jgi:selenophosphate synthetase-related protein
MLEEIAESIRTNPNILEKKEINPIVQYIDSNSFKSSRIHTDIGEDSATIKNSEKYILITTDRIKTSFVENFPFGAGFSSILVSVDDIYACGGTPLAASLIISYIDERKGTEITRGICEASNKFRVPIIRGHTTTNGKCYELSSTMVGEIEKEAYISAGNAQIDDDIILAVDFDGKIGKASKYFYDTTTFKTSENILQKRKAMNRIAEAKLANASKDISNGGIFGTLLQLLSYSEVGANVNIKEIIIPPRLIEENYSLVDYCKMYLTTSFILTTNRNNSEKIIKIFNSFGMNANIIGKIIKEKYVLKINKDYQNEKEVIRF